MREVLPSSRQMLLGVLVAAIVSAGLLFLAYEKTAIPSLNSDATAQQSVIYGTEGSEHPVVARLNGSTTRMDVPLPAVSVDLRHAMLAAEDRHFFHEPAVSATGTLRALITDVRGGDITQGGSTITQQYVKNAYLSPKRTLSRKLDEILIALKLGQDTSKDEILDDYLNTIYFGRGADGIEAAAKAYFGVQPSQLNVAQSALLAAVVNAPSDLDPGLGAQAKAAAKIRWRYVIDGMRTEHWISAGEASRVRFPKTDSEPTTTTGCPGNTAFICRAVIADLEKLGLTQAAIDQGGYKIYTTINPTVQGSAQTAIDDAEAAGKLDQPTGHPEAALVSIQPGTGAIEAMYSGQGCSRTNKSSTCAIDTTGVIGLFSKDAVNYGRPPGSSMKPYTLIAALEKGISLRQVFSGPAETTVDGNVIHNAGNEVCSNPCTLQTALAESINTVFVPLAEQVGPSAVAAVAHAAGIPDTVELGDTPEITLGNDDVPVVDQADGYATIAAGGVQASPFLISKVIDPTGSAFYRHTVKTTQAFSSTIAAEATVAMQQVLRCSPVEGTACGRALADDRPAAGKTGTATNLAGDNSDAWFDGFTPQLATAVWVGNDVHGSELSAGGAEIYGGEIPAEIWQATMDGALADQPIVPFAIPTQTGTVTSPTSSSSGSVSPSSGTTSPTTSTSSPAAPTSSPATTGSSPGTATTSASTSASAGSSTPVPPPAGSAAPGVRR